jgi:hypothetical protein
MHCPSSKVLDNTKRHIPGPEIPLPRIKRVVRLCAEVKDAETGELLFSRATWKPHGAAMNHAKRGFLSDIPRQNYDYYITSATGRKTLMCARGTSHASPSMSFNSARDNEEYFQIIMPVLKCEEGPIEAMFTLFIVPRQSNKNHSQHESINYKDMAEV